MIDKQSYPAFFFFFGVWVGGVVFWVKRLILKCKFRTKEGKIHSSDNENEEISSLEAVLNVSKSFVSQLVLYVVSHEDI